MFIDGIKVSDPGKIAHHLEDFFQSLYIENITVRPELHVFDFNQLSLGQAQGSWYLSLNLKLSLLLMSWRGIRPQARMDTLSNSTRFVFTKKDILRVFDDFYKNQLLDWHLHSTFLSLIPKVSGDKSIIDLCPIAPLSSKYKLIAKVLANQLKLRLDGLVSKFQRANILGREIHDIGLMAKELLDSKRQRNQVGLIFKINLFNAFNCIRWNF